MKNLSLVSFVGIDVLTDLREIKEWESHIPCEFGILHSESQTGNRYPSYKFCELYLKWATLKNVKTSLHLCGSEVINKFISNDPQIINLCKVAGRTQLNINISKFKDYNELADKILDVTFKHNLTVILQQNATKKSFNEVIFSKINKDTKINFLHDSSGGFGRVISKVLPPDPEHFTGYAGGIKPENVSDIVKLIEENNPSGSSYYIDMESGIRENNLFSLKKCREIIDNLK